MAITLATVAPAQATRPTDPREQARPVDAPALFAQFRAMQGLEATFTEEKHLALLAVPLKSSGVLYFQRPGYLARHVKKPEPSQVTITPAKLRVQNRDGEEVIDLRQSVDVRRFVMSLVQVFGGDEKALSKSYQVEFAADAEHDRKWVLTLTPKVKPLSEMMRRLALFGEGKAVTRIEMIEPNGDRTVTKIVTADPKRVFTSKEQKELFGLERRTRKDG